jgi:hypothetical protein
MAAWLQRQPPRGTQRVVLRSPSSALGQSLWARRRCVIGKPSRFQLRAGHSPLFVVGRGRTVRGSVKRWLRWSPSAGPITSKCSERAPTINLFWVTRIGASLICSVIRQRRQILLSSANAREAGVQSVSPVALVSLVMSERAQHRGSRACSVKARARPLSVRRVGGRRVGSR